MKTITVDNQEYRLVAFFDAEGQLTEDPARAKSILCQRPGEPEYHLFKGLKVHSVQ